MSTLLACSASYHSSTLAWTLSIVRDPAKRFISRFGFMRQDNNIFDYKIMHKLEPDAVGKLSKEEWKAKDLNKCILERDPECAFQTGSFRDFQIVRRKYAKERT